MGDSRSPPIVAKSDEDMITLLWRIRFVLLDSGGSFFLVGDLKRRKVERITVFVDDRNRRDALSSDQRDADVFLELSERRGDE